MVIRNAKESWFDYFLKIAIIMFIILLIIIIIKGV